MLFAQESVDPVVRNFDPIPLIAILVPAAFFAFVIAIIVLVQRQQRFSREKQHTERLKMIEAGFPFEVPDSTQRRQKYMHNAFWISFWMVFLVPGSRTLRRVDEPIKPVPWLIDDCPLAFVILQPRIRANQVRVASPSRSTGRNMVRQNCRSS
jgi:hypothetical protein